jgi:flagella basal body P-ring formation protein FlgA
MNKMLSLTTIWILTAGIFCAAADSPRTNTKLIVTLNKDVIVDNNEVRLDQIAALAGPKELMEKAAHVGLGTFCAKGQILYADRNTVLSRLASIGIPSGQVELTGSQTTQIHKNEKCVESGQIVETARACLDKQLAGLKISSIQSVAAPVPVVLNDPNVSPELSAALSRYQTPGTRKITVSVSQGGIPVAQREIVFAVQYKVRRVVAQRDLPTAAIIHADDVRVEEVASSSGQPADWKEPFGLVTRRRISKGSQVNPEWIGPAQTPSMIRRNQQVMVQLDTGAMYLSAPGQALDEGKAGELIRVKRGQKPDERIIYCTIQTDGTVRPQI